MERSRIKLYIVSIPYEESRKLLDKVWKTIKEIAETLNVRNNSN